MKRLDQTWKQKKPLRSNQVTSKDDKFKNDGLLNNNSNFDLSENAGTKAPKSIDQTNSRNFTRCTSKKFIPDSDLLLATSDEHLHNCNDDDTKLKRKSASTKNVKEPVEQRILPKRKCNIQNATKIHQNSSSSSNSSLSFEEELESAHLAQLNLTELEKMHNAYMHPSPGKTRAKKNSSFRQLPVTVVSSPGAKDVTPNVPKQKQPNNVLKSKGGKHLFPTPFSEHSLQPKGPKKVEVTCNEFEIPKSTSTDHVLPKGPIITSTPSIRLGAFTRNDNNFSGSPCLSPVLETTDALEVLVMKKKTSEDAANHSNSLVPSSDEVPSKLQLNCNMSSYSNYGLTGEDQTGNLGHSSLITKPIMSDISISNDEECLLISHWGLPSSVVKKYEEKGICRMFQWQVDCLSLGNVLSGGNLVYTAPTSAGKTLVAEILMLKTVLEVQKKAVIILPYISLSREKLYSLQDLLEGVGVKIGGYLGTQHPVGGFEAIDIAVCTIEKANNLINRLVEEGRLHEIGMFVIDELHMVGDPNRGYLLELLLTKVLYTSRQNKYQIQIVGMSATLPNLDVLARWLQAELYKTDFRPVPLSEYIKIGPIIYDAVNQTKVRDLSNIDLKFEKDSDLAIYLSLEIVTLGHGVLIFCPTKDWCETLAQNIAKTIYMLGKDAVPCSDLPSKQVTEHLKMGLALRNILKDDLLAEVLGQLKVSPAGLDVVLGRTVPFGVAFHHAGLTFNERDILESAFKRGTLKVLVATSTLASGVNLPARRVIIRTPYFSGDVIDVLTYVQMIGRAGRQGVDEQGESILICKENEKHLVEKIVGASLPPLRSCLKKDNDHTLTGSLKRAVLEVIVNGIAKSSDQVSSYIGSTLLATLMEHNLKFETEEGYSAITDSLEEVVHSCLNYLLDSEFVHIQQADNGTVYLPTQLGRAAFHSSLSPEESLFFLRQLGEARKSFVLENELHLIYQIVPYFVSNQIRNLDWLHFLKLWSSLTPDMKYVGERVGVEERFITKGIREQINMHNPKQIEALRVHHRFYIALALNDLVHETSLSKVAEKYAIPRGLLQALQQQTASYAGMVTTFCSKLGWGSMELLTSQFQSRLHFGIERELCDLVQHSCINGQLARRLFNAGYKSIEALANAAPPDLEVVLKNCMPFQSDKLGEDETAAEAKKRRKVRWVWIMGRDGISEIEAAEMIVQEAREMVQEKLGVAVTDWRNNTMGLFQQEEVSASNNSNNRSLDNNSNCAIKSGVLSKNNRNTRDNKNGDSNKLGVHFCTLNKSQVAIKDSNSVVMNGHDTLCKQGKQITSDCTAVAITNITKAVQKLSTSSEVSCNASLSSSRECVTSSPVFSDATNSRDDHSSSKSLFSQEQIDNVKLDIQFLKETENGGADEKNETGNKDDTDMKLTASCLKRSSSNNIEFVSESCVRENLINNVNSESVFHSPSVSLCNSLDKSNDARKKAPKSNDVENTDIDNELAFLLDVGDDFWIPPSDINNVLSNDSEMQHQESAVKADKSDIKELRSTQMHLDHSGVQNVQSGTSRYFTRSQARSLMAKDRSRSPVDPDSYTDTCISPSPPVSDITGGHAKSSLRLSSLNSATFTKNISAQPHASSENKENSFWNSSSSQEACSGSVLLDTRGKTGFLSTKKGLTVGDNPDGSALQIIDVASSWDTFRNFVREWKRAERFSLSVACKREHANTRAQTKIGPPRRQTVKPKELDKESGFRIEGENSSVVGIAICWKIGEVSYLSLEEGTSFDHRLSLNCRLRFIQEGLENFFTRSRGARNIIIYGLKNLYRILYRALNIALPLCRHIHWQDPTVADWLLESDGAGKTLRDLVALYTPKSLYLLQGLAGDTGLCTSSGQSGRMWASAECVVTLIVMEKLRTKLEALYLWQTYIDIEMPVMLVLAKMEQNGVGFDRSAFDRLQTTCRKEMQDLEDTAYSLAGRHFSLSSPQDVANVLFRELKLPPQQIPGKSASAKPQRWKPRGTFHGVTHHFSTSKEVLEQLKPLHPLPGIISSWRKLNFVRFQVIAQFMRYPSRYPKSSYNSIERVFSIIETCTSTGRVYMKHPPMQTIPNGFRVDHELPFEDSIEEGEEAKTKMLIELRSAFVASEGFVLISSDYSQLELRILAHLSDDSHLIEAFNAGLDVFRAAVVSWKKKPIDSVTSEERNVAKRVFYGIIYGQSAKKLAQVLHISEREATDFIEEFLNVFPGVKVYQQRIIEQCEKQGYVETITGRRRHLKTIQSRCLFDRDAARRQAVNTTVQGTAADLVKAAMLKIEHALQDRFSATRRPFELAIRRPPPAREQRNHQASGTKGAFLVLNLHDELIFETSKDEAPEVARLIKGAMETALPLKVKLEVKVKIGPSWGNMKEWLNE